MRTGPFNEGYAAGYDDFWTRKTTPNPYAFNTQAHDEYEAGHSAGYDSALDQLEGERW